MGKFFSIYLGVLILSLLAGLGCLLFGHQSQHVKALESQFLLHCFDVVHEKNLELDDYTPFSQERIILRKKETPAVPPSVSIVDIDLNNPPTAANVPPSPADTATVFAYLKEAGVKHLHLSTHFHWEESSDFDSLLKSVLAADEEDSFESLSLPLILTRSVQPETPPLFLQKSLLPLTKIKGKRQYLPKINKILYNPLKSSAFNTSQDLPPTARFGFSTLDTETPPSGKMFLIARWGNRVILHHSIISLAQLHQIPLKNLNIELGKFIDLGKNKPRIAIDKYGCTAIPPREILDKKQQYSAHTITEPKTLKNIQEHTLITSTAKGNLSIQIVKQPYSNLFHFSQIAEFEQAFRLLRLPQWLEIALLLELTLICGSLYKLRSWRLHFSYLFCLACLYPIHLLSIHQLNLWIPICPLAASLLIAWFLTCLTKKQQALVPPAIEKDEKDEKNTTTDKTTL